MKILRFSLIRFLFLTGICCLFFATTSGSFASGDDHTEEALAAAKAWLAQIDAGNYEGSYAFGGSAMHEKVPQSTWVAVLKALRTPWGAVVSRKQTSHIYKPNGIEGLEGECMIITYDTSFKQLSPAREQIVLKWEDGKWRGAGYTGGPKPNPDAQPSAPPSSTTETQTQEHVKPD